jgi:hypothetical protein
VFIPDTPEGLFEALAEPTLRELYPRFDELEPRNQKMVRLVHTELTKGELSDATFQEFVGFTLVLWRSFNHAALREITNMIDTEDEIDTDWVDSATHMSRMDQFLTGLLGVLETLPETAIDPLDEEPANRYLIRTPDER